MSTSPLFTCSHPGCEERLPGSRAGQEVPPRWTVVRVEEHASAHTLIFYLYLCPRHTLSTAERQAQLFQGDSP